MAPMMMAIMPAGTLRDIPPFRSGTLVLLGAAVVVAAAVVSAAVVLEEDEEALAVDELLEVLALALLVSELVLVEVTVDRVVAVVPVAVEAVVAAVLVPVSEAVRAVAVPVAPETEKVGRKL